MFGVAGRPDRRCMRLAVITISRILRSALCYCPAAVSLLLFVAAPSYAETLADVGPRTGDGETQGLYGSYGCAGLLLRSAKSLAAWDERKYESAAAAIFSARN
jgi:hypothetical protein